MTQELTALPEHLRVQDRPQATRGEKLFDRIVYWGVNMLFNYSISIAITDLFLGYSNKARTDTDPKSFLAESSGSGAVGKAVRGLADTCYGFHQKISAKFSHTISNLFTLAMGGHVAAVVVKLLEDRRDKWSRRCDRFLDRLSGHKPDAQEQARRQARYSELKGSYHKSWARVIGGRVSGMLFNMTLYDYLLERPDRMLFSEKYPAKDGKYGSRRATLWLGDKIADSTERAFPKADKHRIRFWSELALFEAIGVYSLGTVMEYVIKFGDNKKQPPPVASPPAPNTEPTAMATDAEPPPAAAPAPDRKTPPAAGRWADDRVATHNQRRADPAPQHAAAAV